MLHELNRLESANKTMYGSFQSSNTTKGVNLKALKNFSHDVQQLIENRPMQALNTKIALEDCNRFLSINLAKRQPIFKNHTKTNSSILRSEI